VPVARHATYGTLHARSALPEGRLRAEQANKKRRPHRLRGWTPHQACAAKVAAVECRCAYGFGAFMSSMHVRRRVFHAVSHLLADPRSRFGRAAYTTAPRDCGDRSQCRTGEGNCRRTQAGPQARQTPPGSIPFFRVAPAHHRQSSRLGCHSQIRGMCFLIFQRFSIPSVDMLSIITVFRLAG